MTVKVFVSVYALFDHFWGDVAEKIDIIGLVRFTVI